jgi:hypothetical protein
LSCKVFVRRRKGVKKLILLVAMLAMALIGAVPALA